MSKERLEKAKKILNHIKGYGVYDGNDDIEIFEWLIQQVERAEELERKHEYALDDLEIFKRNYKEKRLESRRYKQALEELEETNKKNYWIAANFKFENLKLYEQNKRYREAIIEALHGLKTLPSVAPRLYLISILDKALEREG